MHVRRHPVVSTEGMSQLGVQKCDKNLSTLGLGHLRSLRAALYPGRGYDRQTPVQRVHTGHSSGSPWAGVKPDTLMILRAELNAVPHASLGYHFLREPTDPGGLQKEKGPKSKQPAILARRTRPQRPKLAQGSLEPVGALVL